MSSTRTLTDKIAWTDDLRTIELLDWETRPEDFDRLCEFIIQQFAERDGISREQLFSILPEPEFRRELRLCAEHFTERSLICVPKLFSRRLGDAPARPRRRR
jgi:hypothetical protein